MDNGCLETHQLRDLLAVVVDINVFLRGAIWPIFIVFLPWKMPSPSATVSHCSV